MLKSLSKALRLTTSSVAAAETALVNLAARRETLEARLADAKARLDAARSARKGALESDPAADLAPLTRSVRDVEDEIDALNGVLDDLAAHEEQQHIKLDLARDKDLRAAASHELEKVAGAFDAATADLDAAISQLGKAAARMISTLPPTLHVASFAEAPPEGQSEQQRLVAAIVAEGIANVLPSALPFTIWGAKGLHFRSSGHNATLARHFDLDQQVVRSSTSELEPPAPLDTRKAARALVSDRLRDRAERIVGGEASPALDDVDIIDPQPAPVLMPYVQIFSLQNFAYRLEAGQVPEIVTRRWVSTVPEDVARAAIAANVALRTDTTEGAEAFAAENAARASTRYTSFGGSVSIHDCHDLGVIRHADDDQLEAA